MNDPKKTECPLIRVEESSKAFGGTPVLDGMDLDISRDEVLGLMGPSGCGKSTLLRLLAGLEKPDAGEIALEGAVISSPKMTLPPNRRKMGMIFQSLALWPHLTVAQHLEYGLAGIFASKRRERVESMLQNLHLGGLAHRRPHELSGGERQRVALGRALIIRPLILLCDEPFSSLDRDLRAEVRAIFYQTVRDSRMTAVFVSHDPDDLEEADRVVRMERVAG